VKLRGSVESRRALPRTIAIGFPLPSIDGGDDGDGLAWRTENTTAGSFSEVDAEEKEEKRRREKREKCALCV